LKKLAKSKRRSVAQRAADALKQADENNGAVLIGNAAANGVQVQVQVVAGPGGNVVQVVQQNQNRDIVVEENGKKVHIEEATGKGIKVSITETVDGKEQTKVWQAKDLAELKQKHPEAAKLYQKHAPPANVLGGAIGVGRVQIQGLPAGVQNIQIQAGAQRAGIDRGALAEQIKQANDRLEKTVEGLEKLAADANASPESLRKLAAEIGRIRAELSAVNKKLAE
jgi:hypothetical protein